MIINIHYHLMRTLIITDNKDLVINHFDPVLIFALDGLQSQR